MSKVKVLGWILLSTLIFFCLFLVLQWITYELLLLSRIIHNILLVLTFGLTSFVLPKHFGFIGGLINGLFWFCLMWFSNNLYFEHIATSFLMIIGAGFGSLLNRKKYVYSSVAAICAIALLCIAYFRYTNVEFDSDASRTKLSVEIFNDSNDQLKNMLGKELVLSRDTVYLINFSFYACLPCKQKKPSLHELEKKFANRPFKVIYIHSFESKEVYLEYYKNEPGTYHDSGQILQKKLKISGAPFELLFDKHGNEVNRLEGFNSEWAKDYLHKTNKLITKYLKE